MKRSLAALSVTAIAVALFSGCNSGDANLNAGSAPAGNTATTTASNGGGGGSTTDTQASNGAATLTGESCTGGDSNKICLAIHFVSYQDSSGKPVANPSQVATIIHTMNTLWAQCDIGFQVEHYQQVDPTKSGLDYGANSQNQLDQIRKTYTNSNDELLAVNTGPWGTAVNAWTNMPGDSTYGAIMEASIVDYGGGIIYAHEFGHYLGLDHVGDTSDLMNAVIYTTSTKITSDQCTTARGIANSYWAAMQRK